MDGVGGDYSHPMPRISGIACANWRGACSPRGGTVGESFVSASTHCALPSGSRGAGRLGSVAVTPAILPIVMATLSVQASRMSEGNASREKDGRCT